MGDDFRINGGGGGTRPEAGRGNTEIKKRGEECHQNGREKINNSSPEDGTAWWRRRRRGENFGTKDLSGSGKDRVGDGAVHLGE